MTVGFMHRVAVRDRALLERMQLSPDASATERVVWSVITHAGGAVATLSASLVPLGFDGAFRDAAYRSIVLLVASHLLVQLVKRTVSRERPYPRANQRLRAPDRFSFPSGHACAALSVALGYASTYPPLAVPLFAAAGIIGISRVVLGVHFPVDVLAGQVIAFVTAAAVSPVF